MVSKNLMGSLITTLRDSDNWLGKATFLLNVLVKSYSVWGFRTWVKFWKSKEFKTIKIGDLRFTLRNSSFSAKIADVAAVFGEVVFEDYKVCPIYPKDMVIDIGAHIGGFTLMAAKIASGGMVLAFEPYHESFKLLEKSTKNKSNIIIQEIAIGLRKGRRKLFVNSTNPGDDSFYKPAKEEILVRTETLGGVFKKYKIKRCNVLKIDCEGAEYEILFSCSRRILRKVDRIIMEYHVPKYFQIKNKYSLDKLISYLKGNDFLVEIKTKNRYQGILYAQQID